MFSRLGKADFDAILGNRILMNVVSACGYSSSNRKEEIDSTSLSIIRFLPLASLEGNPTSRWGNRGNDRL